MSAGAHGPKRPIVVLAPKGPDADAELMPRDVVMLAFPDAQSLDVAGPYEVFSAATRACAAKGKPEDGYTITLLSPDGAAMRCESGLTLLADKSLFGFRKAGALHTFLVCGG